MVEVERSWRKAESGSTLARCLAGYKVCAEYLADEDTGKSLVLDDLKFRVCKLFVEIRYLSPWA